MRAGLIAILLVALSAPAAAEDRRTLDLVEQDGQLLVSGAFTDVFDAETLEQMASGFAQTIFVRVWLHKNRETSALWQTTAKYRVVYAQWDEEYLVRLRDPAGERNFRTASRAEALKMVTTLRDLPACPLRLMVPGTTYHLEVTVDLNPVAPELLVEVRRWLARPRGEKPTGDASFFGSFVSVFVNPRIADADRTLHFRSQDFYREAR